MYKALDLAKYIVTKCVREKCPISNLQLQKILYYIQKDFLHRGKLAFADRIEAWQFGPVTPDVYYKFCGFGATLITVQYEGTHISSEDIEFINKIVEDKRKLNPWDLVDETHKDGGAWDQTYQNGIGNHHQIDIKLIKQEQ